MVYIIISNIGLALMIIYIYSRYSHFRIISSKEISTLRLKIDAQSNELRDFDAKFLSSIKSYQDRIEGLLIEVGKVRQEKEKEVELRMQIEKKMELLQQKNTDYETIHTEITNAILNIVNDTHETAKNLEKDLYEKINNSRKIEVEENKKIISTINQNFADFVEKFNLGKLSRSKNSNKTDEYHDILKISNNLVAKNTLSEVLQLLTQKKLTINKNYFLANSGDDSIKASPELIFKGSKYYIVDFKGTSYVFEYFALKAKNEKNAENLFGFIFKKYLSLLSSENYRLASRDLVSNPELFNLEHQIIVLVPSQNEIKLLKDLKFFEEAKLSKIDVMDIQEFSNLL